MNTDELNDAIRRSDGMTREQLLALVRECERHLALRSKGLTEALAVVARQRDNHDFHRLTFAARNAS